MIIDKETIYKKTLEFTIYNKGCTILDILVKKRLISDGNKTKWKDGISLEFISNDLKFTISKITYYHDNTNIYKLEKYTNYSIILSNGKKLNDVYNILCKKLNIVKINYIMKHI